MTDELSRNGESVRCAEVIAALSLATDLGIGVPLEYGLQSTLFAMRLADRLGVDPETASQTYYACLLFYVGCTANADVAAEIFGADDALKRYATLPALGRGLRWSPASYARSLRPAAHRSFAPASLLAAFPGTRWSSSNISQPSARWLTC